MSTTLSSCLRLLIIISLNYYIIRICKHVCIHMCLVEGGYCVCGCGCVCELLVYFIMTCPPMSQTLSGEFSRNLLPTGQSIPLHTKSHNMYTHTGNSLTFPRRVYDWSQRSSIKPSYVHVCSVDRFLQKGSCV